MRAALYMRVSTRQQAEAHGVAAQRIALERMCEAHGWTVVHRFTDEGVSGRKGARPGLNALMLAARRREVDVVLVWRFDRFARNVSHLVAALNEFQALGVRFASQQEGIDTDTPLGRAMFAIAGAFAELEADLARERVAAGLDAARARGTVLGRPRSLTPEEARAAVKEHKGVRGAARALGVAPATIRRALQRGSAG